MRLDVENERQLFGRLMFAVQPQFFHLVCANIFSRRPKVALSCVATDVLSDARAVYDGHFKRSARLERPRLFVQLRANVDYDYSIQRYSPQPAGWFLPRRRMADRGTCPALESREAFTSEKAPRDDEDA